MHTILLEHWMGILLGAACVGLAILSFLQIGGRKRLERRLLREIRLLQQRMSEGEQSRQDSFSTFSQVLLQSESSSEERIRRAVETLARTAQDTQALGQEMRENALKQQLALQEALDRKLTQLQASNAQKLEGIQRTVDEKLQTALQQRIGESFRQVSDQLERVYKGLGEMHTLAGSVGDLRRVLSNVAVRGAWGEARLSAIMEENLTEQQFRRNTTVEPGASERVEFALVLPGAEDSPILLPIDSKFPQADYERLLQACDSGDKTAVDNARSALGRVCLLEGKRIASKYIRPPYTTDFAIMFLPTEGLFAEVMRIPGLCDQLQRNHRVIPAGPTTFTALLTSLQMGFRTLAVEQRSAEVWKLLGQVRKDFAAFGSSIEKTRQRLEQATTELNGAVSRSHTITRRLADLESPEAVDNLPKSGCAQRGEPL